ncbi:MAG: hypothetical protein WBB73_00425 [Candidatus Aminicenantaceae bacterium]
MIEAGSWTDLLRADPRDWLLNEENPSVRYIERKGRPSRWVTLHALQALKGYCRGPRL